MPDVTDPDPNLNPTPPLAEKIDTLNELAWNLRHYEQPLE
jgi:hypothetical protein